MDEEDKWRKSRITIYSNEQEKGLNLLSKKFFLEEGKTDIIDARHLCELYYKEDLEPYKKRGIQIMNLRNLTRQH